MMPGNDKSFAGRAQTIGRRVLMALLCLCLMSGQRPLSSAESASIPMAEDVLTESDRIWRYIDDPAQLQQIQSDEWTRIDYDDSGWLTASGSFGAYKGRRDEVQEGVRPDVCLRHYLPNGSTVPAYFFRLRFSADLEDDVQTMCADVVYDDAVIIYLNGTIIYSGNVPEGGYSSPNAYGCEKFFDTLPKRSVTLDRSVLRDGENVLCVELHQSDDSSSDIYFSMGDWRVSPPQEGELRNETLTLCVGRDEGEALITWQGPLQEDAHVQIIPKAANHFDFSNALNVPAEMAYEEEGIATYRAAIAGLAPDEYLYRAQDTFPTDGHVFTVQSPEGGFFFLCHGDPQIVDEDDERAMEDYLSLAEYAMGGETPQLILSLGDQVDEAGNEAQYRRYTGASLLKEVPLAPVVGNHEAASDLFSRTFFLPNMDSETAESTGDMSGDYWFFRGNALFLCLNSNIQDVEIHRQFLLKARAACLEQYGEPTWTIAAFHHSLFSAGIHGEEEEIRLMRSPYTAMLEEVGVDVVFSGHDHAYTRSWPMNGDTPLKGETSGGIVYFTLGSSTGSKFYRLGNEHADYAAFLSAGMEPAMSRVDVTNDTLTVTTYLRKQESIVLLDTYTLYAE